MGWVHKYGWSGRCFWRHVAENTLTVHTSITSVDGQKYCLQETTISSKWRIGTAKKTISQAQVFWMVSSRGEGVYGSYTFLVVAGEYWSNNLPINCQNDHRQIIQIVIKKY